MYCLVYIVVAAAFFVDAKHLPSYITPCQKNDPDLNECARQHATNAIPRILKGDREYLIPVLSPLKIPEIVINPTPDFNFKLKSITLKGLDNFRVEDVRINLEKKHAEYIFFFKSIEFEGTYEMDGRVLILPIKGTGPANIVCDDLMVKYSFDYGLVTKNGKEYIDNFVPSVDYTVKKIHVKFDNLFNGDKNLGDRTNEFLNEHSAEIDQDFKPTISQTINIIATDIIKKIIPVIPYDEIFI